MRATWSRSVPSLPHCGLRGASVAPAAFTHSSHRCGLTLARSEACARAPESTTGSICASGSWSAPSQGRRLRIHVRCAQALRLRRHASSMLRAWPRHPMPYPYGHVQRSSRWRRSACPSRCHVIMSPLPTIRLLSLRVGLWRCRSRRVYTAAACELRLGLPRVLDDARRLRTRGARSPLQCTLAVLAARATSASRVRS